ncbi:MAG: hypothetical protein ACYTF3_02295 [Planctomycetota bacterium]
MSWAFVSNRYRGLSMVALLAGCIAESRRGDGEVELDGATGDAVAVVSDAAPPVSNTGPGSETGPAIPDAGEPAEPCTISITDGDEAWSGEIPADALLGCDALADLLCDYAVRDGAPEGWTRARCRDGLLIPRGAITLADYCLLPGVSPPPSVADIVAEAEVLAQGGGLPPARDRRFESSAPCAQIPGTSLWGEAASFNLSRVPESDGPPALRESALEALQLELPPILTLDTLERATYTPGVLVVEGVGLGVAVHPTGTRGHVVVAHSETVAFLSAAPGNRRWDSGPTHAQIDSEGPDTIVFVGLDVLEPHRTLGLLAHLVAAGRLVGPVALCLSDHGCPWDAVCDLDQGFCVDAP